MRRAANERDASRCAGFAGTVRTPHDAECPMSARNALARAVAHTDRLPAALRGRAVTLLFNSQVRFAGTGKVRFESLSAERAILRLPNHPKVRNHIGGVHAAAMALLAETATGSVFGMNVPGTHLPVIKTLKVDYLRRAQGALRAEAWLAPDDVQRLHNEDKGDLLVPVRITDESGVEPIACEMIWAWVPRRR